MAIPNLNNLTDLSAVKRWEYMMIQDLPTPESDFPRFYKWVDNNPSSGVLALNRAGDNSGVAQILSEAKVRRLIIKRKQKEDEQHGKKIAKLQVGGRSVEAASSLAYAAQYEGSNAQLEEAEG